MSITTKRECGSCTECCRVLRIEDTGDGFTKPPDSDCPNCARNVGCTIYSTRPSICRSFECVWLVTSSWPDDLRPDHSGLIATAPDPQSCPTSFFGFPVIVLHECHPGAAESESGRRLIDILSRRMIVVAALRLSGPDDRRQFVWAPNDQIRMGVQQYLIEAGREAISKGGE